MTAPKNIHHGVLRAHLNLIVIPIGFPMSECIVPGHEFTSARIRKRDRIEIKVLGLKYSLVVCRLANGLRKSKDHRVIRQAQ